MARRPGPATVGMWERGLVGGRGCPEEARELACARHDGDVVWLAAGTHPTIHLVEALLCAIGDRKNMLGLAFLAVGERRAEPGRAAVMPRRLDQQTPGERRAGLGDRALARALTRLVERWCEPKPCRERCGALEASPVSTELEMDR